MEAEEVVAETSCNDESNMQEKENVGSMIRYTHHLGLGVTKLEKYGLKLAQLSGIPKSIIRRADELILKLSEQRKPLGCEVEEPGQKKVDVALSSLCTSVLMAECQHGSYAPEFIKCCKELQEKFVLDHPDFPSVVQTAAVPQVPNETSREMEPLVTKENCINLPSSQPRTPRADEGELLSNNLNESDCQTSQSSSWQPTDTQNCNKPELDLLNIQMVAVKNNQLKKDITKNVNPFESQISFKPISNYPLLPVVQQYQSKSEEQPNANTVIGTDERKENESENSSEEEMDFEQELIESPSVSPHIIKTQPDSPSYSPLCSQNTASGNCQSQPSDVKDNEEDMECFYSAASSPSYSPIHDEHFPNTFTQMSPCYSNSMSPDKDQEFVSADNVLFKYPPITESIYSKQQEVFEISSGVNLQTGSELNSQLLSFNSSLLNQQCSKNIPSTNELGKSMQNQHTKLFNPTNQCTTNIKPSSFTPAKALISSEILNSLSTPPVQLREPCEMATTPEDRKSPNLPYQPSPIIKRRGRLLGMRPRFTVPVKKAALPDLSQIKQNTTLDQTCLNDSKSDV